MKNTTCELAKKSCKPCEGGVPPLKGKELQSFLQQLGNGWNLNKENQLEKEFNFPDFKQALLFTNKIGDVAEQEGHHPDIHLSWGKVKIVLWTHSIHGLSENDFILASKCDEAFKRMSK
jgi:4a-hydroxytetrahydrobiopterin dehydratase